MYLNRNVKMHRERFQEIDAALHAEKISRKKLQIRQLKQLLFGMLSVGTIYPCIKARRGFVLAPPSLMKCLYTLLVQSTDRAFCPNGEKSVKTSNSYK